MATDIPLTFTLRISVGDVWETWEAWVQLPGQALVAPW